MLQYKKYYMPESKEEFFRVMESMEAEFDIISGGTDLYAKERDAFYGIESVIDISKIAELSDIELQEGSIVIGANTRIQQFLEKQELIDSVPLMRHAASYFADQQIREIATVGGNLANSSPTGDMIPPLLAMGAVIHTIRKQENEICMRETAVSDFIQGVGKNVLAKGEIIHSVTCPVLDGYGCAFKKVGLRRSLCISTVNSAFLVKVDETDRRFEDVRIAFGGIGPRPVRMTEIEERLKGNVVSKDIIQEMVKYIPEDVVKSRSRKEYRKTVVRNFLLAGIYESLAETGILPA